LGATLSRVIGPAPLLPTVSRTSCVLLETPTTFVTTGTPSGDSDASIRVPTIVLSAVLAVAVRLNRGVQVVPLNFSQPCEKRHFWPLMYKNENDHFTKTGSGRT
jgi:hypothetical protein